MTSRSVPHDKIALCLALLAAGLGVYAVFSRPHVPPPGTDPELAALAVSTLSFADPSTADSDGSSGVSAATAIPAANTIPNAASPSSGAPLAANADRSAETPASGGAAAANVERNLPPTETPSAPMPPPQLPRRPRPPWDTTVPAVADYAQRLAPEHRPILVDFQERFPDTDPTETQTFRAALLKERQKYGYELTDKTAAAYHEWLARGEQMQAALVIARGQFMEIAISGTDENGRSFALIGFEGVKPLYSFTQNVQAAISTAANQVRMNFPFDPVAGDTVSGNGLYINVNDHGEIYEHAEFQLPNSGGSRIVLKEVPSYTGGNRDHMTHVSGTVGAWGYNSSIIGMAPRVWIRSHIQQYDSDITGYGMMYPGQLNGTTNPRTGAAEMKSAAGTTSLGLTDTNTSRGVYTYTSASFDQTLWDYPCYIHFYAASNDGSSYATLGQDHPISKNAVTMASVSDTTRDSSGNYTGGGSVSGFSSRGPAFDGRIKPDLSANGEGLTSCGSGDYSTSTSSLSGTSMATPNASGTSLLLIDYFNKRFPGHFLRSSSLKALLIDTADDRGTAGPDYDYGWGIINVKKAAEIVKRYADTPATRVVIEDNLTSSQSWTATYTYDGTGPIRATLAWLDPPGTSQSTTTTDRTPRLVNNLNLRLISAGGTTYQPYVMPFVTGGYNSAQYGTAATTGDNTTDNVEQVYIAAPPAGTYTLQVTHTGTLSGSNQKFSVAVTGMAQTAAIAPALTTISPTIGDANDNFTLTVNGSGFLLGSDIILRRDGSADVAAYGVEITGTQIKCRVNTAALAKGYWDVLIRAPGGTEAKLANAFLLPAPAAGSRVNLYTNTFENGATGLTLGAGWSLAAPNKSSVSGPSTAQEGTNALVTYAGANYANYVTSYATLPAVSTVGYTTVRLEIQRWLGIKKLGKSTDYANVQYSLNGTSWTDIASHSNLIESQWAAQTYTLPAAAAGQTTVYLRFYLETDDSNVSFGWNIDDLKITAATLPVYPYPSIFTSTRPTTATVGQAFSYSITTADTDTAGSSRTLAATGLPAWLTFTSNGDGTATLTGTPSAPGNAAVTLSVADGTYITYQTVKLVIVPATGNTAPVIPTASLPNANVSVAYSATVAATDADGHAITLSTGARPAWLTFTDNGNGTGSFGGTPVAGSNGSFVINVTASDGLATTVKPLSLTVGARATLSLSGSAYSVTESGGSLTVTVNRTVNSVGAVAVNYASGNGTATAGSDYTAASGTLNWADGDTAAKTFTVPIINDTFTEGSETFTVTLSGLTGIADLGTSTATVTITDNDNNTAPVVALTQPSGTVSLPDRTDSLVLAATVTDDSQPTWGSLTTTWSQVSGPSGQNAVFAAASSATTSITFPADGTYVLRLTASDGEFSASKDLTVIAGPATGPVAGTGITRELYSNIGSGTAVSDLTSNTKFINSQPDATTTITDFFEAPTNVADNYGQRMRGYFIAPQTGSYTFVIASDDSSELWLSTDVTSANKVKIASVSGYTSSREWTKYSSQTSAAIALTAGQACYIEALMKEGDGGDNLAVGVTLPNATVERPITGARLAAYGAVASNAAPQVNPGTAPAAITGTAANLTGTSSDDGKPLPATLTTTWSKISGPGTVTFANANAAATTVTFSAAGSYVLRLTATDGGATAFQNLAVTASANTAPTISALTDQTIGASAATSALAITIGDAESAAGSLTLTGSSSNPTLVPNAAIVFGGSGASRTATVTPAANQTGTATITITVSDGALTAQTAFDLTVTPNFSSWISGFSVGALTGPGDDPDGDGLSSLLEYSVAGGNPATANAGIRPVLSKTTDSDSEYATLTVNKNLTATGISYLVEVSGDLSTWNSGPTNTTQVSAPGANPLVVRDNTALGTAPGQRFIRLRILQP